MKKIKYTLLLLFSITIMGTYAQNNPPVAVDDFYSTTSGHGGFNQVLSNDSDPDGDNLSIDTVIHNPDNSSSVVIGTSVVDYTANMLFYGVDTVYYVVCDDGTPSLCDTGRLIVEVTYVLLEAFEDLDVNKVRARFNANGWDFWDNSVGHAYEVPKGGGKHSIFFAGIWIGGKDDQDNLHLSANRFYSIQNMYTGPIMDSLSYSFSQDSLWNKLWKINKSTIEAHQADWQTPGYTPPEVIRTWPGNGNPLLGQAGHLAPFFDRNGDQLYDPLDGDYPEIRGDQAVYFIRNDHRGPHDDSFGKILKIEMHGMAYAYDCSEDSALSYTTFINYKIVNRSSNNYFDTYLGVNFDIEIGDPTDDYIECDVKRGSVYGYNGSTIDGYGSPYHYGAYPPAQAVVYLKGPRMDPDLIDNAMGSCDAAINGYGFGDSIVDNEALGLTHFLSYCTPSSQWCYGSGTGDPVTAEQHYNFLRSRWNDGTQAVYGGSGHVSDCSSCEPTQIMYPYISDSCNWSTMGIVPGDTLPWNEPNAGHIPQDKSSVSSAGPFTFLAGDTIEFDIAYVYGRDHSNPDPYAAVINLNERIDSIRSYFLSDQTPCGNFFLGEESVEGQKELPTLSVHPNPATNHIELTDLPTDADGAYKVYNLTGHQVMTGKLGQSALVDIQGLPAGVFFITIDTEDRRLRAKFVKL
ncbi:MAG: T9SS type A sorting domain-containing protein [Flavobacteriales bacterium]|nr:T9SS type A sorting domain-containing protein [Flavobacteriales bacterium]